MATTVRPIASVTRYSLTRKEAAAALGMSVDTFERRVQPFIRVVLCGQLILVPPEELERWVKDNSRFLIWERQRLSLGDDLRRLSPAQTGRACTCRCTKPSHHDQSAGLGRGRHAGRGRAGSGRAAAPPLCEIANSVGGRLARRSASVHRAISAVRADACVLSSRASTPPLTCAHQDANGPRAAGCKR
jgi:hypothetical protein